MTYSVVRLPPLAAPVDQLWHVLMDLSEQLTVPWTLVGGQMVLLHAVEHGRVPPQISQDGDLIADVRSEQGAITAVVDLLTGKGFELDGSAPKDWPTGTSDPPTRGPWPSTYWRPRGLGRTQT